MISTEEKLEIMQREKIAYKEGFRDALRLVVCLVCIAIIIIIV